MYTVDEEISIFTTLNVNTSTNIYKVLSFYYEYLDESHFDTMELLINKFKNIGGDINYSKQYNPLLLTIKNNDIKIFDVLIKNNAKLNYLEPEISYISKAIYLHRNDFLNYFLTNNNIKFNYIYNNHKFPNSNVTFVTYAMRNGIKENIVLNILKRYIKDGGDITYKDSFNNNMLHDALFLNYIEVANELHKLNSNLKDGTNNYNKKPGDYCLYDTDFCRSMPKNIARSNIFISANNLNVFDDNFPNIPIEKFLAYNRDIDFKIVTDNTGILGKGGFGTTQKVNINGEILAIKSQSICKQTNKVFKKMCQDLTNSILHGYFHYDLIKNDVYNYVSFPNVISEMIISSVVNTLVDDNICINYVKTKNFFQYHKKIFTVMELLDGSLKDIFTNLGRDITEEDYVNILTQMLYALYVFHSNKISHNDIHYGNVLYKKIRSPFTTHINDSIPDYKINNKSTAEIEYFEYCIDGENVRIRNLGYIIKIIDYGLGFYDKNIKGKQYLIRPQFIIKSQDRTFKEFNRNKDLVEWALTFMTFDNNLISKDPFFLHNINTTSSPNILNIAYRIKNFILANSPNTFTNLLRPYRSSKDAMYRGLPNYSAIANQLKIILEYEIIKNKIEFSKNSVIFNIHVPFYQIERIPQYSYLRIPTFINSLNLTDMLQVSKNMFISNYALDNLKLTNNYVIKNTQYISIAKINANNSSIECSSKCCNISGPKLLDSFQDNKAYMSINGAFFDILGGSYSPIAIYKDDANLITKYFDEILNIPEKYRTLYFIIYFNDVTNISFIKYDDYIKDPSKYNINTYKYVMTSPLMYDKKNSYSLIKRMEELNKNSKIDLFNCGKSMLNLKITEKKEFNCSRILPGELTHGKQPNPRSMIIITNNNEVLLVTIEGRDQRGFGMTFEDMENLAIELNASVAINLDGGRSSHITVRPLGFKNSIISNPSYKLFSGEFNPIDKNYPVGNILVFSE